jgi:CRISPR-associated protein Cas1
MDDSLLSVASLHALVYCERRTFDPVDDFRELPGRVLLSDTGRKKVVEVIECRKADTWRHSVVGYSLSYARLIEPELCLLEKESMDG